MTSTVQEIAEHYDKIGATTVANLLRSAADEIERVLTANTELLDRCSKQRERIDILWLAEIVRGKAGRADHSS